MREPNFMEGTELNDESNGASPTDVESETQENIVEESTSLATDLEMSIDDASPREDQDNNIGSVQNEDAHPTD